MHTVRMLLWAILLILSLSNIPTMQYCTELSSCCVLFREKMADTEGVVEGFDRREGSCERACPQH